MGRSLGSLDAPIGGKRDHSVGRVIPMRPRVNPEHPSLFDRERAHEAGRAIVLLADEAAAVAVELARFRHLSPHPAVLEHLIGLLTPEGRD